SFLCTAFPPLTLLPRLAKNLLPSTLDLHLQSSPDGSDLMNVAPVKKRLQLLSPLPAQRHRTLQTSRASPPFPLPFALNAACALAPGHNVTIVTNLDTIL